MTKTGDVYFFRYRLNSRFIEHRCPYLIPFMQFNETTQQYTVHTAVPIDIVNFLLFQSFQNF